ncbi:MAG: shikimate dehydrogenase [Kiritimatiellae bacterium]|nr:shikimate dehydrogenase [Verrucomicrobiota bacterium]MBU4286304.1 shikimate dehydrogenase [Verrucomicrobiota bacterium]MBU4366283.1 shikimate dehydrogenase [Verrucomicrobiota bacterium]MCG2659069.1 shikimate dehydrogenase [Kiritimatiellia bacterium]
MTITPATQKYAVLGHPISHSLSPRMQNAVFKALAMDAVYLAFDVPPEKLMQTLPVMAEMGFVGINLTVPLKEVAFRGLADLDEAARRLGSVNTVKITAGGLKGFSTDGEGFLRAIREAFDLSVKGLSLFLLGCGGAGRAVAFACAAAGAGRLMLADADGTRLAGLEADLRALGLKTDISAVGTEPQAWRRACREAELVVHATPMGMHIGEPAVLPPDAFHSGQRVYDLIYMFPETVLMRAAREAGARTSNGLGMLMHQGALSFSIWTGREAPVAVMRCALEEAVYGRKAEGRRQKAENKS